MSRPSRSFVIGCAVAVLVVAMGFVWPDSPAIEPHAPLPAPTPTVEQAEPRVRVWVAERGVPMLDGKRSRPKRVYHYFKECGQINRRGGFTGVEREESQLGAYHKHAHKIESVCLRSSASSVIESHRIPLAKKMKPKDALQSRGDRLLKGLQGRADS